MRRLFIGLIAGVSAIVSTGIGGAGGAAAAPIPNIALYGHNLATMGDHSLCRGTVNLAIHTPQNKRGVVRVTARSLGFGGDGAAGNEIRSAEYCSRRLTPVFGAMHCTNGCQQHSVPVPVRRQNGMSRPDRVRRPLVSRRTR